MVEFNPNQDVIRFFDPYGKVIDPDPYTCHVVIIRGWPWAEIHFHIGMTTVYRCSISVLHLKKLQKGQYSMTELTPDGEQLDRQFAFP